MFYVFTYALSNGRTYHRACLGCNLVVILMSGQKKLLPGCAQEEARRWDSRNLGTS